ncbi:hypothetical protein MIR68_000076 [Amoeboaphelidium protococcarum]|nr:hypothetical protein MIR68_000076 [Amoeboaphelidium protococcarum]KAI3652154.1 hypothetical protein MP228_003457 [Amoeboaphelidium protococcarum]
MSSPFDSDNDEEQEVANIVSQNLSSAVNDKIDNGNSTNCCVLGRIEIIGSERVSDGGSAYTAYIIDVNGVQLKRRYSEFESIRKILKRLYPHLIIPPIPEKHKLTSYATLKMKKAAEDSEIVEVRKKMLQSFLRKVNEHPVLSKEHLFHRFLEQGTWSDVLFSSSSSSVGQSQQSSQQAQSSVSAGTKQKIVSKVGPARKLKNPDLKFLSLESGSEQYLNSVLSLEKSQKGIFKKLAESDQLLSELGLIFNGISLNMNSEVSIADKQIKDVKTEQYIEAIGGVYDTMHELTQRFNVGLKDLSLSLHEQSQIAQTVVDLLKLRHLKHAQWEDLGDTLEQKKMHLNNLEQGLVSPSASGSGFFGAITGKFQSLLDNDPEMTRRNNVAKLKDTIITLEKSREEAHQDLLKFNELVSQELNRFQEVKTRDLRAIMERFAKVHHSYFEKCVKEWEDVLQVLDQ